MHFLLLHFNSMYAMTSSPDTSQGHTHNSMKNSAEPKHRTITTLTMSCLQ